MNNPDACGQGRRRSQSNHISSRDSIMDFMKVIMEGPNEDDSSSEAEDPAMQTESKTEGAANPSVSNQDAAQHWATYTTASPTGSALPRPASRENILFERTYDQLATASRGNNNNQDNSSQDNTNSFDSINGFERGPSGQVHYPFDSGESHPTQQHDDRFQGSLGSSSFASTCTGAVDSLDKMHGQNQYIPQQHHNQYQQQQQQSQQQQQQQQQQVSLENLLSASEQSNQLSTGQRRAASLDLSPKYQDPRDQYTALLSSLAASSAASQQEEDAYLQAAGLPPSNEFQPFQNAEQGFHNSLPNIGEEDRNAKRRKLMLAGRKAISERVIGSEPMYNRNVHNPTTPASTVNFASSRNLIGGASKIDLRHVDTFASTDTNAGNRRQVEMPSISHANFPERQSVDTSIYDYSFQQDHQVRHSSSSSTSNATSSTSHTSHHGFPTAMDFTSNLMPIPESQLLESTGVLTPEAVNHMLLQQHMQQQQFRQNLIHAVPPPHLEASNFQQPTFSPGGSPTVLGPSGFPQLHQFQQQQQFQQFQQQQQFQQFQQYYGGNDFPVTQQFLSMNPLANNTTPRHTSSNELPSPSTERKKVSVAFDTVPLLPPPIPFSDELGKLMKASQESQQSIHDWDRKMGLRRSHSKTMRASRRSRKKLQEMRELQEMLGQADGLVKREERAKTA